MNITFEELKERFEAVDPKKSSVTVTCICGNHVPWQVPSDDDIRDMVEIINGKPQTESKL